MTKNTKKLLGLVGALAVLGGAYGGIVWINQNNEEKAAEQSKAEKEANTFYLSQMEEPVSISYTNSYGTFAFSYDTENETWSYDSDEHFPVTQSYLTSISSDLKSFTAERKLEEVQDDLSVYGLDNPSCTITAKGSDDTEVTIQIGSLNSYNSDYYAKVEGSDDIYTIEEAQKQLGKEEKQKTSSTISENARETYFSYITNSLNSKNSNITESYNTYTQNDFIFDTNFFTQNLEIFSCLSFLSDGEKILTPQKLKMLPYFKN